MVYQGPLPDRVSALVVGGGPAGLVSLKYLIEYGPKLDLISKSDIDAGRGVLAVEMEDDVGGTFR
jgi:dimethylaniline monooxygenase (N-oxide forming)